MHYLRMVKRWDIIIVIFLILFSFLPSAVFSYHQANVSEEAKLVAIISLNNEEIKRVTLTGHKGTRIVDLPEVPLEHNTVELRDEEIRIKSADCPDQICVLTGYISKPGQTIVCLHHRLVIEVVSDGEGKIDDDEDILISY